MWGWVAAPEENRKGERASPEKGGSSLRGRGNGPPQGLVCPPPGLESPGPSLPVTLGGPRKGGKRGEGLNISPQRGAERLPTQNRTRPLGAPHPSLFDMSRTLSSAAATKSHVSSWRSNRLDTSPLREGPAALLRRWGGATAWRGEADMEWSGALGPHPDAAGFLRTTALLDQRTGVVGPPRKGEV
jgi:hypothetical protein